MELQELILDALKDWRIRRLHVRSRLQQIHQKSSKDIIKEMDPPAFKLQIARYHLGTPTKTIMLHFDMTDWNFKETSIVAKRITGHMNGLTFLKNNSAVLDVSQGLLHFPHFTYSIETYEIPQNKNCIKLKTTPSQN